MEPIPQARADDTRKRYFPSISTISAKNPGTCFSLPEVPRINAPNPYRPRPSVLIDHPEWSKNATIYQINTRQFTDEGTFSAAEKHLSPGRPTPSRGAGAHQKMRPVEAPDARRGLFNSWGEDNCVGEAFLVLGFCHGPPQIGDGGRQLAGLAIYFLCCFRLVARR